MVTGAAGFIGSNLLVSLAQDVEPADLVAVDLLDSSDKWKNLADCRFSHYFDRDEFLSRALEDRLPGRPRAVFHLGACSSTTERDSRFLMDTNTQFTLKLAQWCLNRGIRFIYASSAATYGDGSRGYADDDKGLSDLRPLNMYGYSKQLFDLWASQRGWLGTITGLKFFNVYGPREAHKGDMRSVIHKSWPEARDGGTVKLFKSHRPDFKDGEQTRDFVHVDDCVAVMKWLLTNPKATGIFNLGSGEESSWNKVIKALFKASGKPEKIQYIDMPESIRDQYQYRTKADMKKLRKAGYSPSFTGIEEGVQRYVTWLKAHPGR